MAAANLFVKSTVKFISCIGNIFGGESEIAPSVSHSAYLGHEAHLSAKPASSRTGMYGRLAA